MKQSLKLMWNAWLNNFIRVILYKGYKTAEASDGYRERNTRVTKSYDKYAKRKFGYLITKFPHK